MIDKTLFNHVPRGQRDIVQLLHSLLQETGTVTCVIEGLAVHAYAKPVVSLHKDLSEIMPLVETHPELNNQLPPGLAAPVE